jgi:hypothetical protein
VLPAARTSLPQARTAALEASGGDVSRLVLTPKDSSVTVLNRAKKVNRW